MVFSEAVKNVLALVTGDGFFKVLDFSQGREVVSVKVHSKIINSLSCNHHLPQLYLTSGDDGVINLIDIN